MVRSISCLIALCALAQASPFVFKRATTTSVSTTPTAALVETTISGSLTTVLVAPPTGTATTGTATTTSSSSPTSSTSDGSAPSSTSSPVPNDKLQCLNGIDQPICVPTAGQVLFTGNTYWVNWNPDVFALNSTINIVFQDINDTSKVAWTSPPTPKEAGFTTVTIDKSWLGDWESKNFTLVWIAYAIATSKGDPKHKAFDITIANEPAQHYPAPPPTTMPSKHSLLIGLPIALGVAALIILGLFFGFREQRKLGIKGGIYGRRRGYGTGKSRRERMGLKKGAIRLDEVAVNPEDEYRDHDDAITPMPRTDRLPQPPRKNQNHTRDLSLGSLVGEEEPSAFRREIQSQAARK